METKKTKMWVDGQEDRAVVIDGDIVCPLEACNLLGIDENFAGSVNFEWTFENGEFLIAETGPF